MLVCNVVFRCLRFHFALALLATCGILIPARLSAEESTIEADTFYGDALLAEYFQEQTNQVADDLFSEIESLEDWENQREARRNELFEMLGLDPMPEKTPLEPVVTGEVERQGMTVERLHFQAMPGLYVTGNLYRPTEVTEPLPAVLYVCGHGRAKKDDISYGNKATYQHHGAWFAQHGYVCLTIDTIQLGEIEGHHHGTHRYGWWWWNNRGYTPAGVEAWNCIRSLDYLQSRPEVDGERIGVTGRSGGGIYSWWVAALDERIKAAVPVAGITSMKNHVVDGCVEGHCDCMFMVNTYRWDFPMIAALVAPRPLLISNSDKDRIFPLDGVVDVYQKVQKIYRLYDAEDKLGLNITEGPHKDTQELRIHAFRWLNRFLRDDESLIERPAVKLFEPEELKVFDELPEDERVTTIHESFVPSVSADEMPTGREAWESAREEWMNGLNEKSFRGWPTEVGPLNVRKVASVTRDDVRLSLYHFNSQSPYRLPIFIAESVNREPDAPAAAHVKVLGQSDWGEVAPAFAAALPESFSSDSLSRSGIKPSEERWAELAEKVRSAPSQSFAYLAPRGIGPTQWTPDERKRTHIRRRFMLLGQTLDSMRVWDVRRALQALQQIETVSPGDRILTGEGPTAVWAVLASLYEDDIAEMHLDDLPSRNRDAMSVLNISRFVELPHLLTMAADRVKKLKLTIAPSDRQEWSQVVDAGEPLWSDDGRLHICDRPTHR